jgi:hypothetical protein
MGGARVCGRCFRIKHQSVYSLIIVNFVFYIYFEVISHKNNRIYTLKKSIMLSSDSSFATLPFSKAEVFNALITVATKMKGFKINKSDELLGRVNLSTSASATSWGESIPVQLNEIADNRTQINIVSKSKTGILGGGAITKKNEQNVELLISNVSNLLQGKGITLKGGSSKGVMATLLIGLLFGWLGFHRFYVGKWKTGLLYMVTFGLLGVGWAIDLIRILLGNFTDSKGNYVSRW